MMRTVLLDAREVNVMTQRWGLVINLLKKAPDDGLRNRCVLLVARNRCAVAEARKSGALLGPWEGGETPTQHIRTGLAEP